MDPVGTVALTMEDPGNLIKIPLDGLIESTDTLSLNASKHPSEDGSRTVTCLSGIELKTKPHTGVKVES